MADVYPRRPSRRKPLIDVWAEQVALASTNTRTDAMLTMAILFLAICIGVIIVVNTLVTRPDYAFVPNATAPGPPVAWNDSSRGGERVLGRIHAAMESACASANTSAVAAHEIHDAGVPLPYAITRLCDSGVAFVNPKVVFTGKFRGRCMEQHANKSEVKQRGFPVHINHTNGVIHQAESLSDACLAMHAYEILHGTWWSG